MKLKNNSIGKKIMRGSSEIIITGEENEKRLKWLELNFPELFEKEEIKPIKKTRNDKVKSKSNKPSISDSERDDNGTDSKLGDEDTTEEAGE